MATNYKNCSTNVEILASYINQMQQWNKWMFEKYNVKIGDLVLLIEGNFPLYKWAMGKIIKVYFGDDHIFLLSMWKPNIIFVKEQSLKYVFYQCQMKNVQLIVQILFCVILIVNFHWSKCNVNCLILFVYSIYLYLQIMFIYRVAIIKLGLFRALCSWK